MTTNPQRQPRRDELRASAAVADEGSWLDRLRPEEGWLSVALVMLLCAVVAWSIADARWILNRDDLTSFLIWIAPIAAFWGFLSARLGMSRWAAHATGAAIGAFILIEVIGSLMPDAEPSLQGWFQATANSVTQAYLDLTWRHLMTTSQYGHFCLVLGIVVWGTSQAAAYDIFGHRRAVNGVLLLAVVLVANMSLTIQDQFAALVIFSAAALMLLILAHSADEQMSWLRHRIWRAGTIEMPQLRGGMTFAGIAVIGSLVLTSVASSAPLASAWPGLNDNVRDFAIWISRFLPSSSGGTRIQDVVVFPDSVTIGTSFNNTNAQVFTVRVPNQQDTFHWRVKTYDTFNGGWDVSRKTAVQAAADAEFEAASQDAVSSKSPTRKKVLLTVDVQNKSLKQVINVDEPSSVNVPTTVYMTGANAEHVSYLETNATSYQVTAYIENVDFLGKGLTENQLRVAGQTYPPGLAAEYTQGTEYVGSQMKDLLAAIRAKYPTKFGNPYDIASSIQSYLQEDGGFRYSTDIGDVVSRQCTGLGMVDCFAKTKVGFCVQFASTMTMLLRMEGIPARYVQGYLPGSLNQNTSTYQVTMRDQHAWVEAFFPGYGWITFDPTTAVGIATSLPQGEVVAPASSEPRETAGRPQPPQFSDRPVNPGPGGAGTTTGGGGTPIALAVVGIVAALLLLLAAYMRRRPRRLDNPDVVYRSIVRLAGWLGYRPQPTQTVYEYVGMLGTRVPRALDQLEIVGRAKVEVTYGRRELPRDRLLAVNNARAKLRTALLRLALRRPTFRRRRG